MHASFAAAFEPGGENNDGCSVLEQRESSINKSSHTKPRNLLAVIVKFPNSRPEIS